MGEVRGSIPLRAYHLAKIESDLALIRAELGEIHRTMATKSWILGQNVRPARWCRRPDPAFTLRPVARLDLA